MREDEEGEGGGEGRGSREQRERDVHGGDETEGYPEEVEAQRRETSTASTSKETPVHCADFFVGMRGGV